MDDGECFLGQFDRRLLRGYCLYMRFKEEELSHFEDKLSDEKAKIENNLKAYEKELDFGDEVESKDSFEEETDEAEEEAIYLGIKNALNGRLKAIDWALTRIRDGKYGICSGCDREIDLKVLEAEPESVFCLECKKKEVAR